MAQVNPPSNRRQSSTAVLADRMRRLWHSPRRTATLTLSPSPKNRKSSYQSSSTTDGVWEPNDYTRSLLRRTWSNDFDFLYQVGSDIYEHIFETVPDALQLFPSAAKHGANWKQSSEFNTQVLRFVQVIAESVRNLRDLEDFQQNTLYHVGRAHCKFSDRGFRPQHWLVFQSAIKKTMKQRVEQMPELTKDEKTDAVNAWYFLAEQIVVGMQKGFRDGMKAGKRKYSF